MKKNIGYILSFFIPFFVLIIIFLVNGIITNKYVGLVSDSNGQYYDFFLYLKDVLNNKGFLSYSFSNGIGGPIFGLFVYYLACPLNLLLKFIQSDYVALFMVILMIIKLSLSGLTMFIFLKYHFKDNKYLFIFSTCYALSLYNIANYFQIMWLDGIMLAPLVLLGIDKLIKENKVLLYCISLFLTIFCNYYIGYMICIFSVIYFIYRIVLSDLKNKKIVIKKYLIISILSGLLTSIITIPAFLEIINTGRFNNEINSWFNLDIIKNISKMLFNSYNYKEVINKDFGYFYCGLIIYPLLYFYFVNKNINKKEKIISGSIIIFFILSIIFEPFNIFWHAFSVPIGFNYRYLFLLNIFVIYLSVKSFDNFCNYSKFKYYIFNLIFVIINILAFIYEKINIYVILANILLMIIYLIILYNFNKKSILKLIMAIIIVIELFLNCYLILKTYIYYDANTFNNVYKDNNKIVELGNKLNDSNFYRMELASTQYNDALYLNYNGLSAWSSTVNSNTVTFFKKIGFQNNLMNYRYIQNYVTDSLLGLKYVLDFNQIKKYKLLNQYDIESYDKLLEKDKIGYFYENPYYLSLGYMVNKNIDLNCDNPFECQNVLLNSMTDFDNVYKKIEINKIEDSYSFKAPSDTAYIYIDIDDFNYKVYVDGKLNNMGIDTLNNIITLNNLKIGKIVNIKIVSNDYFKVKKVEAYELDFNHFTQNIEYLKENQLNVIKFTDNYVCGNINLKENGLLFTTIPYDKGWSVYVDGNKVNYEKMYNTFIGIELVKGNHYIEFKYRVPGIKIGATTSIISLFCLIIYFYFKKVKN